MNKMKKALFALVVVWLLPVILMAQHGHGDHANSNALDAKQVSMEHSLYHMNAEWTNHRDETLRLSDFSGKALVITMYYGNCVQVCPILIRDANRVFEAVDESIRDEVRVLAVTFDPENDTPTSLHSYAEKKGLNLPEWHFITGAPNDIRELAMLLGVEYTKKSDGHFAHSNLVTILDRDGRIAVRLEGLNQPVEEAVNQIEKMFKNNDEYSHHK